MHTCGRNLEKVQTQLLLLGKAFQPRRLHCRMPVGAVKDPQPLTSRLRTRRPDGRVGVVESTPVQGFRSACCLIHRHSLSRQQVDPTIASLMLQGCGIHAHESTSRRYEHHNQ